MKTLSVPCVHVLSSAAAASRADVLTDNLGEPVHNPAHVGNDF